MRKVLNIIDQLNIFGLNLPYWPKFTSNELIKNGYLFAETIFLWETKLKNFQIKNQRLLEEIVRNNDENNLVDSWELYLLSVFINGELKKFYYKLESSEKLIKSLQKDKEKTIGLLIFFARNQNIHLAIDCLKNLFNNQTLDISELRSTVTVFIKEYDDSFDFKNSINNIYGIEKFAKLNKQLIKLALFINDDKITDELTLKNLIINSISEITEMKDKLNIISNEISSSLNIEIKNKITYKITKSEKEKADILIVHAGHLRSYKSTFESHRKYITKHFNYVKRIFHTWDTQYPETISWRGYIKPEGLIYNPEIIKDLLISICNPDYLQIDAQVLDDKYNNDVNNKIDPLEGMNYGAKFFKYSRLLSILMTLQYMEINEIYDNIPIFLIRPDILIKENFKIDKVLEEAKENPVFFYNKSPDSNIYKATDCLMVCYSNSLRSILENIMDKGLIYTIQKSYKPFSEGGYNKSWTICR